MNALLSKLTNSETECWEHNKMEKPSAPTPLLGCQPILLFLPVPSTCRERGVGRSGSLACPSWKETHGHEVKHGQVRHFLKTALPNSALVHPVCQKCFLGRKRFQPSPSLDFHGARHARLYLITVWKVQNKVPIPVHHPRM